jgi:hypothetical protein
MRVFAMASSCVSDDRAIALAPAIAVVVDYALTFSFAGSEAAILTRKYSPVVRYAVDRGIMALYVVCMVLLCAGVSWLILRALRGTPLYPAGTAIVLPVSRIHVLGGLSRVVRSPQ